MAAAAAALTFAAEPAVNQSVSLSGDASVTWGVDLDTGKTGFKNEENATLEVVFTGEGTKETTGEGIWAEIQAKGTALSVKDTLTTTPTLTNGAASIEKAQLHFGPVYVGIRSGNTLYGAYKIPNAVRSADSDNAEKTDDVAGTDHTQGIVAGYSSSLFDVAVDFRSKATGTNYYNNDYGVAAETTLKFVPNLSIGVGADYQINDKALGVGANASYKIAFGEKFYLQPSAAFTMGKIDTADPTMNMAAGVLFGWGATADANAGVYYLDVDATAKKVTPGIGIAAKITNLTNNPVIRLVPSFYSGDIIPNLTAAALAEINIPTASGSTIGFGVAAGIKYALAINDSVKIIPQAGMRFAKGASLTSFTAAYKNPDNGGKNDIQAGNDGTLVNVKVGADITGLINNTTFSVDWTSRNLTSTDKNNGQVGTINVGCKIAL